MKANNLQPYERLPSGRHIQRQFNPNGSLREETHSYGVVNIVIKFQRYHIISAVFNISDDTNELIDATPLGLGDISV